MENGVIIPSTVKDSVSSRIIYQQFPVVFRQKIHIAVRKGKVKDYGKC